MDCLFIHGNYPGQFRHLAPLIANAGHNVKFLTNLENASQYSQERLEIRQFELHRKPSTQTHHYLQSTEDAVLQGQAIAREIDALITEGFRPRIVVSHAGNGLGLFVKDLLPKAIHIGYFEWYFKPETTKHLTAIFDLNTQLHSSMRNLSILQELELCDIAVVPTRWQKQQFPDAYQEKLQIIFDGIDRSFFHPLPTQNPEQWPDIILRNRDTREPFTIPQNSKVISYATRGMETLRGFPEFMRALPSLLNEHQDLYAVIAGADRRAYSHDAPSHGGSWKDHMLSELNQQLPTERVLFTGLLDYNDYRSLLWRSNLHCYFTRPYVTSWSLFESAGCGARLAVNMSPATRGITVESSVTWVTLEDQNKLSEQLANALNKPGERSMLLPEFDLQISLQKWEKLLNHALKTADSN